jgi:O-antigen ligase
MLISRLPESIPFAAGLRPMVLLATVAIALALTLPQTRAYALFRPVEARALLGLLGLMTLGIPTSYWPGASFGTAIAFLKILTFFFLITYCIRTRREFRLALWSFLAAILYLELWAALAGGSRVRITHTYDPNDLAFVIVSSVPAAVMLFFAERGRRRWVLPVIGVLGMLTVILTKSRGGFVALAVVGVVTLAKLPSRIPFLRTGVALGTVVIFMVLAPDSYWERVSTIWGAETRQAAADGYLQGGFDTARWEIWKHGLRLIAENPLLGVGAGAFVVAEGSLHKTGGWLAPHNTFIQVAAELGLPGLAVFLFLLYRGFVNCRRVIRVTGRAPALAGYYWTAHGLETALCGYIVAGFALTQALSDIPYFLLAMSVVLVRLTLSRTHRVNTIDSANSVLTQAVPWWKPTA